MIQREGGGRQCRGYDTKRRRRKRIDGLIDYLLYDRRRKRIGQGKLPVLRPVLHHQECFVDKVQYHTSSQRNNQPTTAKTAI